MIEENDYELLYLVGEGSEEALNRLYEKYKPLINSKARKAYNLVSKKGVDLGDITQEAMLGFEEAIRGFKDGADTLFYTFACLCIDRKISTFLRTINRNKNKVLNEALSIDYTSDDENDSILNYVVCDDINPENKIISKENEFELSEKIDDILTPFEKEVIALKIGNYSLEEISKKLNKDLKSIYNAMQRIRDKVKKIIE